jgi:transcriptional regulator with XRE-family HTH domain
MRTSRSINKARSADLDKIIGSLVRSRRVAQGMSQSALGDKLGVTFQQIQKYEKGVNRISGATLYRCAEILDVPVTYFFQHLPKTGNNGSSESNVEALAFLSTRDGVRLMAALNRLPQPVMRKMTRHIRSIAEALSPNRMV